MTVIPTLDSSLYYLYCVYIYMLKVLTCFFASAVAKLDATRNCWNRRFQRGQSSGSWKLKGSGVWRRISAIARVSVYHDAATMLHCTSIMTQTNMHGRRRKCMEQTRGRRRGRTDENADAWTKTRTHGRTRSSPRPHANAGERRCECVPCVGDLIVWTCLGVGRSFKDLRDVLYASKN